MRVLPNRSRRSGLRTWEIALFVWAWQAAGVALATGVGALVHLALGPPHGLLALLVVLASEPLRAAERKSWEKAKASHD